MSQHDSNATGVLSSPTLQVVVTSFRHVKHVPRCKVQSRCNAERCSLECCNPQSKRHRRIQRFLDKAM